MTLLNLSLTPPNLDNVTQITDGAINAFDTLCMHCANHDIDTTPVDDSEFQNMAMQLESYAASNHGTFWFWLD